MTIHRDRSRLKLGLAKQVSTTNRHFSMSKRELMRNKSSYCFLTWFLGHTSSSISLENQASKTEWMTSITSHSGTSACQALWSTNLTCRSMLQLLKPCSAMKSQTPLDRLQTHSHRLNFQLMSWKISLRSKSQMVSSYTKSGIRYSSILMPCFSKKTWSRFTQCRIYLNTSATSMRTTMQQSWTL